MNVHNGQKRERGRILTGHGLDGGVDRVVKPIAEHADIYDDEDHQHRPRERAAKAAQVFEVRHGRKLRLWCFGTITHMLNIQRAYVAMWNMILSQF